MEIAAAEPDFSAGDTPLDRVFVAATRLAEFAHQEALRRFAACQVRWLGLPAADVSPGMARAVLYLGDGLYFDAMLARGPGGLLPNSEATSRACWPPSNGCAAECPEFAEVVRT